MRFKDGYARTAMSLVLDQAFTLENAKRLANRHATGTESLGKVLLPNPFAGADRTVENLGAQVVGNALAGGTLDDVSHGRQLVIAVLSRSKALPFGYDTNSHCMPHGVKK